MKIAVIGAKGLPPEEGGIEHHCAEIYPRMVAQGHSVDLFARSFYTRMPAFRQYDFKGVRVISLPCPKVGGSDVIISSALGAMLTAGDYDIVHFHALGPSLFSWLTRMISPAKVVVTCHGLDWQRAKWGKLARLSILLGEKIAVSSAHEMVVVSGALQSYFINNYSRDSAYIPNAPASYPASDTKFTWTSSLGLERGRYMVFLGRLVPEKCPDLLIKAFQSLQKSAWKLVLVGGDDSPTFKAKLLSLANNNPNILFTGPLLGAHLAEIVRGSGLFVLPSDIEGLPMAMLEAMAEGVPILASDILPHRQLLGQNRGVLFRKGDVNSCIEKLDWAIHNTQEIQKFAEQAKIYVSANYNWEQITNKFIDLYNRISTKPLTVPTSTLASLYADQVKSATLRESALGTKYLETDS
ncbi:glycosyltransferase family 4 protein [Nostoc sp.]